MWIRTQDGDLLNLDCVESIYLRPPEKAEGGVAGHDEWFIMYQPKEVDVHGVIATIKTPEQAQAAMDRLEKWIADDGWTTAGQMQTLGADHQPVSETNALSQTRVFSFRTLSEDDEF